MSEPIRTCVGCRQRALRAELTRHVLRDGVVVPDPAQRLPGRGAWLHDDDRCRERAARGGGLERSLRRGRNRAGGGRG